MDQSKGYSKHIACLESYWNEDVENRLSVIPVLDLLGKTNGTKSFVLTCNTPQELEFNLDLAKTMRGYRILYLAFHGFPGGIWLSDIKIEIEYLGALMGRRFRNWIVFFDSCQTMRIGKKRLLAFMDQTGVMMVMGYKKDVAFLEGAAVDLLALSWLQTYKNTSRFWSHFRKTYKSLISITGLEAIHRKKVDYPRHEGSNRNRRRVSR